MSEPERSEAPEDILARANERSVTMGLPYAGAVTPAEAWTLGSQGAAQILDVRTMPEWQDVGHIPDAPLIEWPRDGSDDAVRAFAAKVEETLDKQRPVLFLCRSGVRSHNAAQVATLVGFAKSYNILEGFEGNAPGKGWRAAGLPWSKGPMPGR